MAKIQKSFRLEKNIVTDLENLLNFYNEHMPEFSIKKATMTDIVAILIQKEIQQLRQKKYDI